MHIIEPLMALPYISFRYTSKLLKHIKKIFQQFLTHLGIFRSTTKTRLTGSVIKISDTKRLNISSPKKSSIVGQRVTSPTPTKSLDDMPNGVEETINRKILLKLIDNDPDDTVLKHLENHEIKMSDAMIFIRYDDLELFSRHIPNAIKEKYMTDLLDHFFCGFKYTHEMFKNNKPTFVTQNGTCKLTKITVDDGCTSNDIDVVDWGQIRNNVMGTLRNFAVKKDAEIKLTYANEKGVLKTFKGKYIRPPDMLYEPKNYPYILIFCNYDRMYGNPRYLKLLEDQDKDHAFLIDTRESKVKVTWVERKKIS